MKKPFSKLLFVLPLSFVFGCYDKIRAKNLDTEKPFNPNPTLKVSDYGTIKYEAENMDVTNWVASSDFDKKVIASDKASGGYYVASSTDDASKAGNAEFSLVLEKPSVITLTAAYAQSNKWLSYDEDMSKTYAFVIESNSSQIPYGNDYILKSRSSTFDWYKMKYNSFTLPEGTHKIKLNFVSNTGTGCPCIDYFEFLFEDPNEGLVNPTLIDGIPSNDFHTAVQYQYINDLDWHNIFNYARGASELSIPRSIDLTFSELDNADRYFVQVSKGNSDFSNSPIYETSEKSYSLWNSELGQKYYFRASTSQEELASANVKNITINNQAPRNLNVDGISNFRDIGGWKSSLIKGGYIKQGLYYRCAKPEGITDEGKQTIKDLNIKVDIDMRDDHQVPSASSVSTEENPVRIVKASIPSGTESRRWEEFNDVYKLIFEEIANADQGSIMLHCTAGADRTGITTFFLLALCGVSEADIGRDYAFTNFSTFGSRDYNNEFVKWINKTKSTYSDKPTFAEQMKAHLMSKGLSSDTLEHIREIFVPGYVKDQEVYIPEQPADVPSDGSEYIPDMPKAVNEVRMVPNQEVLFEAENAIPTAWKNSGWGGDSTFVAYDTEANASGGAFVTPATGSNDEDRPNRKFSIILTAPFSGTVVMKVAYCRGSKNTKNSPIDYSYVYQYRLNKQTNVLTCQTSDPTDSATANWNWREIVFTFNITAGQNYLEGFIDENTTSTNAGCPCIDYYKFTLGVK